MEIGKSFSYIKQDPHWVKKLFIGSIVTAIPLVEAVSDGFQIETIKNLKQGKPQPLSDWNDASQFFKQGIALRLTIYAIYVPTFITTAIGIVLTLAWLFGTFTQDARTSEELNILRWLGNYLFVPALDAIIAVLLPIVFLVVPALARRLADGESAFSLFNPFPTLRLIFANFGDYALTRIVVFAFGIIATLLATSLNVLPVVGTLAGWLVLASARFTGRLVWAYSLAHMQRRDRTFEISRLPKLSGDARSLAPTTLYHHL